MGTAIGAHTVRSPLLEKMCSGGVLQQVVNSFSNGLIISDNDLVAHIQSASLAEDAIDYVTKGTLSQVDCRDNIGYLVTDSNRYCCAAAVTIVMIIVHCRMLPSVHCCRKNSTSADSTTFGLYQLYFLGLNPRNLTELIRTLTSVKFLGFNPKMAIRGVRG